MNNPFNLTGADLTAAGNKKNKTAPQVNDYQALEMPRVLVLHIFA